MLRSRWTSLSLEPCPSPPVEAALQLCLCLGKLPQPLRPSCPEAECKPVCRGAAAGARQQVLVSKVRHRCIARRGSCHWALQTLESATEVWNAPLQTHCEAVGHRPDTTVSSEGSVGPVTACLLMEQKHHATCCKARGSAAPRASSGLASPRFSKARWAFYLSKHAEHDV